MSTHTPHRLPDTMTRADIGPYMRGLREHFALSQQDVSERLHIRHRYIEAIERGQYEQMPGQAYAKGYVHTYAEFLGLDADQAVAMCFGAELVREQAKHYVPEPQKRANRSGGNQAGLRTLGILGVVAAILVLAVMQFTSGSQDETSAETVAEVPEDMLAAQRTMLMPVASNDQCLEETGPLGCLLDSASWQRLQQLSITPAAYLVAADYEGTVPDQTPLDIVPVEAAPEAQ